MKNINDYWEYLEKAAKNCKRCHGERRIRGSNSNWVKCRCQDEASMAYKYHQIPVCPEELKYKEWTEFTGEIKDINNGKLETIGCLTDFGVFAKKAAMNYCFNSDSPEVVKNRRTSSTVLNHLVDGQNIIISGGMSTGKTLLAALITREIVYAAIYQGRNISFRWEKNSKILHAARWTNDKEIDYSLLDTIAETDFLFIEDVDFIQGGHNTPPDMICMNNLFESRIANKKPTIVICSPNFYNAARDKKYCADIARNWGEEFLKLVTLQNNLVIKLQKNGN